MSSCHCGRCFSDPSALQQHQRSKAHCYCRECDRFFVHTDSVEQHRAALHSFICFDCDRPFVRPEALQRHQNSMGHCYCRECDRFFVTSDALSQHLQSPLHTTQFHCCDCDRDFVDEQTLHQHLADKIHNPRTINKISSIKLSNWVCKACEREFKDKKGWNNIGHLSFTSPSATSNALGVDGVRSDLVLLRRGFTTLRVGLVPRASQGTNCTRLSNRAMSTISSPRQHPGILSLHGGRYVRNNITNRKCYLHAGH